MPVFLSDSPDSAAFTRNCFAVNMESSLYATCAADIRPAAYCSACRMLDSLYGDDRSELRCLLHDSGNLLATGSFTAVGEPHLYFNQTIVLPLWLRQFVA